MPKRHADITRHVYDAPGGPEIGAFFDFDGTLIGGYSAFPFIREQLKTGRLSRQDFLKVLGAMANFGLEKIEFEELLETSVGLMEGESEADYLEFGEMVFRKHIAAMVYPESRALVNAHLEKGHTVAIVSSATRYQIEATALDLGVKHLLCTELEVKRGKFTGAVKRNGWGEGKVEAIEALAEKQQIDFKKSFAYTDGKEDVPLLERVGNPRPLNPGSDLERTARRRHWPVKKFTSRGRTRPQDFLRSVAATYSLVPTFAAGLPVWALTGSKREAMNYSLSLFADTAGALIGLNLNVRGEHHLWEHRPAVFVFNHQSKTDVVIIAKLIRRDLAGVGKQEIRNMPVIGQILEFGGVVMIDRKNAESAIEAMAPLVDVMVDEGKSVCMAPEGTRTVSPKLAPFKKGAFHLAMQAGVPMVPIVIHNALDAAPKGTFTFRPATVEVEVLPPVDTSEWSAETVEDHVAEVRGMFLKALGQTEAKNGRKKTTKAKPRRKAAAKKKSPAKKKASAKSKAKRKPRAKAKTKARATTPDIDESTQDA